MHCSYFSNFIVRLLILIVSIASLLKPETSGDLDYVSKKKTDDSDKGK